MKANELRIGNFVKDRGNKVIRIDFMEYQESGYSTKFGQRMFLGEEEVHPMTEYTDYAIPIEITEEWLLKFGFTNIDNTNIYVKSMHKIGAEKLKSLAVYIDENNYTIAIVDYYTGVEKTDLLHLDYEFVHQLQNLYFALTGEELTII
jgi:hypothetical protein